MTDIQYSTAVGEKFYKDGSIRYYPGITTVCHIRPEQHPQYQMLVDIHSRAQQLPFAHKRGFLPPSSLHMTVFDMLCEERRGAENWTGFDESRQEHIVRLVWLFKDKLKELSQYKKFVMVYNYLECIADDGLTLRVVPKDEEYNKLIRGFRDEFADVMKIKHPKHDEYSFHISMNYPIQIINEEEAQQFKEFGLEMDQLYKEQFGELVLDNIDYCVFHNMYHFEPVDNIKLI